jgi:hypothetical protein
MKSRLFDHIDLHVRDVERARKIWVLLLEVPEFIQRFESAGKPG